MKSEMDWMTQAYEQAIQARDQDEVPVGAVIVKENQLISVGMNQKEKSHSCLGHAELIAIQEASRLLKNWRLLDCELYVTLEPCIMCLAACQQARLSRVIYGAKDPKAGAFSLGYAFHQDDRLNHRFEAQYQEFLPGSEILKEFFRKKR